MTSPIEKTLIAMLLCALTFFVVFNYAVNSHNDNQVLFNYGEENTRIIRQIDSNLTKMGKTIEEIKTILKETK